VRARGVELLGGTLEQLDPPLDVAGGDERAARERAGDRGLEPGADRVGPLGGGLGEPRGRRGVARGQLDGGARALGRGRRQVEPELLRAPRRALRGAPGVGETPGGEERARQDLQEVGPKGARDERQLVAAAGRDDGVDGALRLAGLDQRDLRDLRRERPRPAAVPSEPAAALGETG
jgi:hypothetical protein